MPAPPGLHRKSKSKLYIYIYIEKSKSKEISAQWTEQREAKKKKAGINSRDMFRDESSEGCEGFGASESFGASDGLSGRKGGCP